MAKGYKIVITHALGLTTKYNYSAWPRIALILLVALGSGL